MKSPIVIVAVTMLLSGLSLPIAEAKQYRCNGRVQYRPCEVGTDSLPQAQAPAAIPVPPTVVNKTASVPHRGVAAKTAGKRLYARIVAQKFHQSAPQEGIWSGIVEGNGDVHLQLQLKRNGRLETTWYMGHVRLINNSSSFKFVTLPPKGTNWSWNIVATAKSVGNLG